MASVIACGDVADGRSGRAAAKLAYGASETRRTEGNTSRRSDQRLVVAKSHRRRRWRWRRWRFAGGRGRRLQFTIAHNGFMTIFRTSVTVLAVIHAAFVGLTSLVGAFADGGDVWQRLLLILLHPLGAAGVLLLVLRPPLARTSILALVALLTANVIADLGPCAADGCWQRAGRLGACASLLGGSGHRDYLRAGTAAHGPRNSQIRLRPRGAER